MLSAVKSRRAALGSVRLAHNLSAMTSNASRPTNWKAAAPPPLPGPTFAAQQSLPKLPVPELADTLAKLKQTLRPIAWSREELDAVEKKIDAFATGLGPELQKRLQARAQEPGRLHWLEEWWDDLGYQGYRDSAVVNVSYYCEFSLIATVSYLTVGRWV
jgi:carnitine O-acetyltransferase